MKQFYLAEIVTKDTLVHQGLFFHPSRKATDGKPSKAILWVHGLTDNFYGDLGMIEVFVDSLGEYGWAVASFNTRGHDIVTSVKKIDSASPKGHTSLTIGSGYEIFSDCIFDIDAGISFLAEQGFGDVVIAGASTGANKVCYYAGTTKDPRVAGVLLVSPISDVPIEVKSAQYKVNVKRMKTLVKQGKGEMLFDGVSYLPLTPARYLSLFESGGTEDVFDYYRENPKLTAFSRIKQPLCVVLAGADEYSDRPVAEIAAVYRVYQRSKQYHEIIIPDAFHSYGGKEQEVVGAILRWIRELVI